MFDVLIITHYFPPEIGAASNRIYHLANGLQERNYKVAVVTPLPNYPNGEIFNAYKGRFSKTTTENNLTLYRLWIYASNSKNKLRRLFAMLSYCFSLIWFFMRHQIPNKVIVQSPPLLVAFTCMCFLRRKKRTLILNVSDLWPLAGLELGALKQNFGYKILEQIECFNYKKADLVLGQSQEILTHIKSLYPDKKTFLYRNFPDFTAPRLTNANGNKNVKLVYAGLLGVAQGVYKLCKNLDYSHIEFHIYGAGAEKDSIIAFICKNPHLPIRYHGEIPRTTLHKALLQYDLAIIPLLNRIYGSVPSKIFEYAHLGLPMVYFGGGEGEVIITKNELGWVAKNGDYKDLNKVLANITISDLGLDSRQSIQQTAIKHFNFNTQFKQLIKQI